MGGYEHGTEASPDTEFEQPRPPGIDAQSRNAIEKNTQKEFTIKLKPEDLLYTSKDWTYVKEHEYDVLPDDAELPDIDKDNCMPGLTIQHSVGQQTTIDNGDDPT